MRKKLSLFLILILAFLLRIVNLDTVPNGFFCDEASVGFNAYSLVKTGWDEFDRPWPLFFRALGEYKSPVQIYSTLPFIIFFGLSEFSVRVVSAVYGILTVLVVYFLVKEIRLPRDDPQLKKLAVDSGVVAALLLGLSPWHIHFSRVGFEIAPFVFFTTLGTWLFLKSLRAKNQLLIFSLALFAFNLSLYSYFPARIFIPLFLTGLIIIFRSLFRLKTLFIGGFVFFLLALPLLFHIKSGQGLSRWQQVSVFKEKTPSQAAIQIAKNYLNHFSIAFLFQKGDIGMPGQFITRHSVRGVGELYWFQLPLIFLGAWGLWSLKKHRELGLIFWWLTLYPLGSALTLDATPQATRSVIGVLPFQILSAAGFSFLLNLFGARLPRRLNLIKTIKMYIRTRDRGMQCTSKSTTFKATVLTVLVVALVFLSLIGFGAAEFLRYLNLYFYKYPNYSSDYWGWQWGFREIVEIFAQEEKDYDELLITHRFNRGGTLLKFYQVSIPCQKCKIAPNPLTFDLSKKQLFAVRKEGVEELEKQGAQFITQKTLYYPDGKPAFFLGEIKNSQGGQ